MVFKIFIACAKVLAFVCAMNILNTIKAIQEIRSDCMAGLLGEDEKSVYENDIRGNIRLIVNETAKADKSARFNMGELIDRIKEDGDIEILSSSKDPVNILLTKDVDTFKGIDKTIEGQGDFEIKRVKRNALDSTTKMSAVYDKKLTIIFGQYSSISRGFDLSYFHKFSENKNEEILATLNFTDPKVGGDTIQVLSRLENPKTVKNIVSLYNGGNDAKILMFGENGLSVTQHILGEEIFVPNKNKLEKSTELKEVLDTLISIDQETGWEIAKKAINGMDLPFSYGITETSSNARRSEMGVRTYKMVMEGKYSILNEEDREKLYQAPVVDLSNMPTEIKTFNENDTKKEVHQDGDIDVFLEELEKEFFVDKGDDGVEMDNFAPTW